MQEIYQQYKDGKISRKEVYNKASEILNLEADKIRSIYERYFKPSHEECSENITNDCEVGNYALLEEKKFEEFIFFIAKNNQEKIKEITELAKLL